MSETAQPSDAPSPQPPPVETANPTPADVPSPGARQEVAIEKLSAGRDATFIAHQKIVQMYVEEELLPSQRKFSAGDAAPLNDHLAEELSHTVVCDDSLFAKLMQDLEKTRVLLLTGQHNTGKRTLALYLGLRVARQSSLVVESLERHIAVDLGELAGDGDSFGRRATIFIDAFDQRNRQLRSFFTNGSAVRWTHVIETLRRNDAYLIFTSASGTAPPRDHFDAHIAHCELQPLPSDKIEMGIDQRLAWMTRRQEVVAERLAILTQHRERIVRELQTLPRIVSFVNRFVRDDTDVEQALLHFRNVPYWFRTVLDRDVGAWAFVLTLALAQPTRGARAASWADFERMRRAITERLRTDPEFTVRRNSKGDAAEEPERTIVQSFSDDFLLERCRATIVKDADRLGDLVQFEHPSLCDELWQTLLAHHRRALMAVLPVLTKIAEESDDWSVRVLAAQALGRIGVIDPRRITVPLVQRWSSSDDRTRRPLVGRMIQGVLGSENDIYRDFVLDQIQALSRAAANENPRETSNAVLTAIGAYSQIGVYEADLAMKELGAIAIEFLTPIVADVHTLGRAVETVDTILSEAEAKRTVRGLLHRRLRLSGIADRLLEAQAPALLALEQAVVHLCLIHDPIQILRKMRDWTSKGGEWTGTLVALLFLLDGIAADLQGLPLAFLTTSKEAVHHLCAFLLDIHESISGPFRITAALQRELRERFNACLIEWARAGAGDADLRAGVVALFATLANARKGVMERDFVALLDDEAFAESRAMRSFAEEVRNRVSPGRPR